VPTLEAQRLITAPIARKIMRQQEKQGNYFNLPTMGEIENFYYFKKGWWSLRDIMVKKYNSMAMLEVPLGSDKDSQQDPARNNQEDTGRDDYSIDPSPFDTVTQAISMAAKMRAYANTYPTDEKHTPALLREYGKFGNAILDMQSKKRDYIPEDMSRLINTGWLIKLFPFDQHLMDQNQFPFQIENLSPLGVYPDLDVHGQVLRVCIEKRLTGSQLLENYSNYQGVRELFDDEFGFGKDFPPADSSIFKEWSAKKNNLLTTEFEVVRYYDRVCTALLVNGCNITETAAKYNSGLSGLKDVSDNSNKKKLTGIYTKAKDRDSNPWYGVSEHNLGRVPMVVEFCWPEIRDSSTLDPDSDTGRLGGLPLMWAGFSTWKEMCRNFSMLNNLLYKTATAPLISNIEGIEDQWGNSDIIKAEGDQKAVYATPPQVQQQIVEIMGRLQRSWDKGTFAPALSGVGSETSGRQTNMVLNAGGVRFDHVVRKIGRAWSGTIEGITEILRERGGDEPVKIWGFGKKYDGVPYAGKFKAALVGATCPGVEVELKRIDAMVDSERIAQFKSADGVIPAVVAYDQILEVPNPQQMYDDMRQEKIDTEQTNMLPDVEIGALEKQLAVADKKADLEWKIQEKKDIAEHNTRLEQTKLDLSQLSSDELEAKQRAFLQQKMQEASQPPQGPGSGQGSNPFGMNIPNGPPSNVPQGLPPNLPPPGMIPGLRNLPGLPPSMMPPGAGSPPPPPFLPGSPPLPNVRPPMIQMQGPPRPPMPPMMQAPRPMPRPMPMMPPRILPGTAPGIAPGLGRRVATAPGQAQQPIQPLSRDPRIAPGGVGTTGVGPRLVGPQGLPGQPVALPNIERANQAVAPIRPLPTVGLGKQRNGKRRRAGK
jgi:hypothetical protein